MMAQVNPVHVCDAVTLYLTFGKKSGNAAADTVRLPDPFEVAVMG
jgi:hypothetical protein